MSEKSVLETLRCLPVVVGPVGLTWTDQSPTDPPEPQGVEGILL